MHLIQAMDIGTLREENEDHINWALDMLHLVPEKL